MLGILSPRGATDEADHEFTHIGDPMDRLDARGAMLGGTGCVTGDERRRFRDYALASRRRGGRWHPRVSVHGWMASQWRRPAVPRRRDIARGDDGISMYTLRRI